VSEAHEPLLARAVAAARASGAAQLAVVGRALSHDEAARDPLDAFAAAQRDEPRFFLARPSEGMAWIGIGACAELATEGAERLAHAGALLREHAARMHVANGVPAPWLGGFAFSPRAPRAESAWRSFGSCRFALPRAWRVDAPDGARIGCAIRIAPSDELGSARVALGLAWQRAEALASAPPAAAATQREPALRLERPARGYRRLVAEALDAIAKGEADKLVVARAIECRGIATLAETLRALRAEHPRCATFAVAPSAPAGAELAFTGATPELLVRLSGGAVEAQALAGSARRGRTAAGDGRARRELLASAKERCEHEHVVASLRRALAPLCAELRVPEAPRALALGDVQHLETPIRARLAGGVRAGALELAERLHPSPAISGAPRDAAAAWLAANEPLERGWYAGAVGVLDASGDGELHVALRCALLEGERARLYAGAGVVSGSRPDAEARETRMKLRAVLRALRGASRATG
jgi:isochorismate synthase